MQHPYVLISCTPSLDLEVKHEHMQKGIIRKRPDLALNATLNTFSPFCNLHSYEDYLRLSPLP